MASGHGDNSGYDANSKAYVEAPFWKERDRRIKAEAEKKAKLQQSDK